ncbi:alpha/beta fold hydrolase [Jeongeupia naejangsanensis]|uniref:Alpha/beta hydrolase n=1 Tax=Jeongeupia naejangsanensis TaxID=613195 RepID=A0ABS2BIX4_9NEIS|nr:alpha/beta hydrolase [Jeongeupia naejangsanensis]MBM3115390.1 alpha/beta hydrolase [Jeongeupia naejangsanensis]
MPQASANGLQIEYEQFGDASDPAVMLIMGLGMQLIGWPDEFCQSLAGTGFRVIRFDNRDIGLSSYLDDLGAPSLPWNLLKRRMGLAIRAPYSLDDMATDTLALMDALGIDAAHVAGVSMGGMIAQLVAARAPQRVLSLTSIMSTSGAGGLPGPTRAALAALVRRPPRNAYAPDHRDTLIDWMMRNFAVIQSPGFPTPAEVQRARLQRSLSRAIHPSGVLRQLFAVAAAPDRSPLLASIEVPSLIIHGSHDPLIRPACGRDCAAKIPSARLVEIDGMGHDMAPGVCARLLELLPPHFHAATVELATA